MAIIKDVYGNDVDGEFVISDQLLINIRYWAQYETQDGLVNIELKQLGLAANRLLAIRNLFRSNQNGRN